MAQLKVAVVGGGIYGCTIATDLARAGVSVDLYETKDDVLEGSTSHCQGRLHSGYHYPRSNKTATECQRSANLFRSRYPESIIDSKQHFYAIAPGSKVTPDEYLSFMNRNHLSHQIITERFGHVHTADLLIKASEAFIDVHLLRRLIRRNLRASGVQVHSSTTVHGDRVVGADLTVWATYGSPWRTPLRYEICEVALLELGRYDGESYVVMDGEFTSLDPHGNLYALYDVLHSVHHTNVGYAPEVPPEYIPLLASYGKPKSPLSHLESMIESASRWLWGLHPGGQHTSIYHGSLWSLRAVLPDVDATDERPVLINQQDDVIQVLSGKIGESIAAAKRVTDMVLKPVLA